MAINAYCGVMGSGKSYEVVSGPLLDAVAAGRRVVTNVDGVSQELIHAYLHDKRGLPVDRMGSIVHVRTDDVRGEGFFPVEVESSEGAKVTPGFVRAGDLVVIDEAWKLWASDQKISKEHMSFFRMHRHFVHEQTGVACDVVLMIQSIADLHRSIKAVVELSFRMVKLKSVGLSKGYRVEMYETSKQTKAMQTGTFIRKYRPEIFPLYNSYAGGAGVESTVDARQNVFARKSFWIVGAVVLVLGVVSVFFVWRFFHERLAKGSVPGPVIGSSSSAVRPAGGGLSGPAAAVAASSAVSDTWRLVGSVFAHGARYVVMVDDKGRLRVGSPGGFVGEGIARVGWVDGRRVMAWSGPPEVAPAHAAPSLSAAAGVGK